MAYTFEQSYYFRPYRGNSSFWLNRYGNGSIASHQKATLYTAAGSADQRLKVHKVSGGCQLLSDLNNAYGLNIYGTKAGSVCDFYPVSGNFNDALIDLLTVDAANNLYRIKMINHNLCDSGIQFERCCSDVGKCIQCRQSDLAALRVPVQRWRQYGWQYHHYDARKCKPELFRK